MKLPAEFTLWGREFHRVGESNTKGVHSIFVLTMGVKRDQNWMTEVGRLAHCIYMPKIDSDVIIVQLRGGM